MVSRKPKVTMIPMVLAQDMPAHVLDWMMEHDYSTHYQNEIVQVPDDENDFAQWLREIEVDFGSLEHHGAFEGDKGWITVGVYAT